MQETRVRSLGLKDSPGGWKWQPTPVFLPLKSYGQRSLLGYSPWGHKKVAHDSATKQQQTFLGFALYNYWSSEVHFLKVSIICQLKPRSGFPGGSERKESTYNAGDLASISGLGRRPGKGNGYPLQYTCLENSMDRGAWRAAIHGITKSWTQLSDFHFQG